jgi:hypothetical protein
MVCVSFVQPQLTLAGEGIELAVATEHNRFADSTDAARRMKVADYFTCAVGNEVTTPAGHFIAFPATNTEAAIPDFKLNDWPALMASPRAGGLSPVPAKPFTQFKT